MKRLLSHSMLFCLAAVMGCVSGPRGKSSSGGQPPLLDRDLFFADPVITGANLSPDGQYLAFIKPHNDVRNIWVKRLDEGFDKARPITADKRPVPGYFWSRDGSQILYVQDKGGNENFHIYAVDPAGAPDGDTGVPAARDLTPIDGIRAIIYSVPRTDPNTIIVGLNDRDASYHDVYQVDIRSGKRTLIIKNTEKVGGYVFDKTGRVRMAMRPIQGGGNELLRVDGGDMVRIYTTTFEEQANPVYFHPDGKRAYLVTNKGADVDLTQLMMMDLATGKTELIETDPDGEVDFGAAVFNPETDELLATLYVGDRTRVYPKTDKVRHDIEVLRAKFPEGELGIGSTTRDWSKWLVSVSSDVDPGSTYLYERESGKITLLYRARPDLPGKHLAPMKPVRYTARDGLEIPGYLTLPKGVEAKNLPTIMFPHGGPWARDRWGYDPYAQFLANRGYAVLQPNFRSSSGYGKKYLNAGNRTWGTGAMQHDLTDGVKWLIDQGIADPKRVCIFGGSYGGYATLAGVTFTPDLYACGLPYVAPSNLITLIDSFPAYWRPFLEGTWYKRVGDPAVAADRKDLEARSPLNFVDRIKVPLLVIHGANDPRVKQAEADQIVVALRDKGHAVEYIVAPDEGHGFRAPENNRALAVAVERFLAKHLGGRVQNDVPDAVAKRLSELTVDIKSVKLPTAADDAVVEAAKTAPLPVADGKLIKAGKWAYKVNLEIGPQKLDLTLDRTIESKVGAGRSYWSITDAMDTPMGKSSDSVATDAVTLRPFKRTIGGSATGEIRYNDKEVAGKISAMGNSFDVKVALDAPVLADGPGMVLFIAGLPLIDGYKTTLRQLDTRSQKVGYFELAVTGTEKTTVAAGTFATYVVKLRRLGDSPGESVIHVMRDGPHHVVKATYKLPASMANGTMKTELTQVK